MLKKENKMTDFSRKYQEVTSGKFEGNELMFQFFDEKEDIDIFLYNNGEVISYDRNTGVSKILLEDDIDEVKHLPYIRLCQAYKKRA